MSELFKELEDDLKQERLDKLWKKIGKTLIGISGGIVLITIGYQVLEHRHESIAMERTDAFLAAIESAQKGDDKAAMTSLDTLTQDEGSSYYGLAMLKKAALQKSAGDDAGAAATYQKLAEKSDAYGQLAKLYTDTGAAPVVSGDKHSPFFRQLEERRAWQLLEQNKKPEAVAILASLYHDETSPAPQRARLQEVLQHLAPETLLATGKTNE